MSEQEVQTASLKRSLELGAFASLVDALQAAGPLNQDRRAILQQTAASLKISQDRYKAEIRRAIARFRSSPLPSYRPGSTDPIEIDPTWALEARRDTFLLPRKSFPATLAAPHAAYSTQGKPVLLDLPKPPRRDVNTQTTINTASVAVNTIPAVIEPPTIPYPICAGVSQSNNKATVMNATSSAATKCPVGQTVLYTRGQLLPQSNVTAVNNGYPPAKRIRLTCPISVTTTPTINSSHAQRSQAGSSSHQQNSSAQPIRSVLISSPSKIILADSSSSPQSTNIAKTPPVSLTINTVATPSFNNKVQSLHNPINHNVNLNLSASAATSAPSSSSSSPSSTTQSPPVTGIGSSKPVATPTTEKPCEPRQTFMRPTSSVSKICTSTVSSISTSKSSQIIITTPGSFSKARSRSPTTSIAATTTSGASLKLPIPQVKPSIRTIKGTSLYTTTDRLFPAPKLLDSSAPVPPRMKIAQIRTPSGTLSEAPLYFSSPIVKNSRLQKLSVPPEGSSAVSVSPLYYPVPAAKQSRVQNSSVASESPSAVPDTARMPNGTINATPRVTLSTPPTTLERLSINKADSTVGIIKPSTKIMKTASQWNYDDHSVMAKPAVVAPKLIGNQPVSSASSSNEVASWAAFPAPRVTGAKVHSSSGNEANPKVVFQDTSVAASVPSNSQSKLVQIVQMPTPEAKQESNPTPATNSVHTPRMIKLANSNSSSSTVTVRMINPKKIVARPTQSVRSNSFRDSVGVVKTPLVVISKPVNISMANSNVVVQNLPYQEMGIGMGLMKVGSGANDELHHEDVVHEEEVE